MYGFVECAIGERREIERKENILGNSRSARRSRRGPSPGLGAAMRVRRCWRD